MKRNDWMRPGQSMPFSTYVPLHQAVGLGRWRSVKGQLLGPRTQFADAKTWRLFHDGTCPSRWRDIAATLIRKLDLIQAATSVEDLAMRGGGLEIILSEAGGRWSLDVGGRCEIAFRWIGGAPSNIQILELGSTV